MSDGSITYNLYSGANRWHLRSSWLQEMGLSPIRIVRATQAPCLQVKCANEPLICICAFLRRTSGDSLDVSMAYTRLFEVPVISFGIRMQSRPSLRRTPKQRLLAAHFKNGDAGALELG
jgi:hypothetical protein